MIQNDLIYMLNKILWFPIFCHNLDQVQSGRSWVKVDVGVELDGLSDWNWTVMNQTGRSKRLKVDGLRKWTVCERGRSAKVDGPEIQKWTVQREKTVRSEVMNLDGLKG